MSTVVPGGWPPSPANDPGIRKVLPVNYIVYKDSYDGKYHADSNGSLGVPGTDFASADAGSVIQSAVNAMATTGGVIGFVPGTYTVTSAFQSTGDGSSFGQILIPANNADPMVMFAFVSLSYGVGPYLETSSLNTAGQVILQSTANGVNNNYYLMNVALGSFLGNTSNTYLYFNGITFRTGQTKVCGGLNVFYAAGTSFGSLAFDTDSQNTIKGNSDIALAWCNNGNVNGSQHGDSLTIVGYPTALATSLVHLSLDYFNATRNTTALNISGGAAGAGYIGMLEVNIPSTIVKTDNHTFRLKIGLLSQVDTPTATVINCQSGSTVWADISMVSSASITMTNTLPTNGFVSFHFLDANTLPATSNSTAGASPFTFPQLGYDAIYVLTTVGGMTVLTLDTQALFNGAFSVGQHVLVKAGHTLIATWATTAPIFKVLPQ